MNDALKRHVVPSLRSLGFKGSIPNFYRQHDDDHVDLLAFQFNKYGGSFVVEIGFADPERQNVYFARDTPSKKLEVNQTTRRLRVGAKAEGSDFWFAFDGEPHTGVTGTPDALCEQLKVLLNTQALSWWNAARSERPTST